MQDALPALLLLLLLGDQILALVCKALEDIAGLFVLGFARW
jgi:hypothetical protein